MKSEESKVKSEESRVMKIGVIVAMDKELEQLQKVFSGDDVLVRKCGIGKVNAAIGTQRMIAEYHPDAIISSGCAGGNGVGIAVDDVIVSSELAYHDVYCGKAIDDTTVYGQVQGLPARFKADSNLLEKALDIARRNPGLRIKDGLIVTGDWFVDSREKMESIVRLFPEAKAVDMESAAIAQTCYVNQVPFISLRVVSDVPLNDDHASQYHDFWDNVASHSFAVTRQLVDEIAGNS